MAGGHDRHRWRVFVLHRIRWRVFPRTHQRNDVEAAHPALAGFLGEYAVDGHLSGWAVAKSLAGFFWPGPNRWRVFFGQGQIVGGFFWQGPIRWRVFLGRAQISGGFFWAGPKSLAGFCVRQGQCIGSLFGRGRIVDRLLLVHSCRSLNLREASAVGIGISSIVYPMRTWRTPPINNLGVHRARRPPCPTLGISQGLVRRWPDVQE